MYGYIYKITNLLNNKFYIGKHKYNKPELDESYFSSGKLINQSLNKYGKENFKVELIDIANTLEELNDKEVFYIKELDCMVPNGYNLTKGGDGISEPSKEIIEKNRAWHLGRNQSSESNLKRSNTLKGKTHNKEWVDKISQSLKGRMPAENTIQASLDKLRGSRWYNDGKIEKMLQPDDLINYPDMKLGRLKNPFPDSTGKKHSEERKKNSSLSHKGLCWYNDGIKEFMFKPDNVPEGFVKGRLKKAR